MYVSVFSKIKIRTKPMITAGEVGLVRANKARVRKREKEGYNISFLKIKVIPNITRAAKYVSVAMCEGHVSVSPIRNRIGAIAKGQTKNVIFFLKE